MYLTSDVSLGWVLLYVSHLLHGFIVTASPMLASWRNSTDGIHAFLTFDSKASPASISAYALNVDYVWGASEKHAMQWRQSPNPEIVLSKYIPFTRDPGVAQITGKGANATALPWWQKNMPELVLYRCDRVTPAWECFSGEGCRHVNVPLDLTNPATLQFQLEKGVLPAKAAGYNAIAFDNYGLTNQWEACGAFKGPNGTWVQIYDASDPKHDPKYRADVIDWTHRAVEAIHSIGLLVIPNFSGHDDTALAVAEIVDGILAEGGWTIWNPRPNTSSMQTPPHKTTPARFEAQVLFVRKLQRSGKGYFAINEWGPGPDYGLNPGAQPFNISGPTNRAIRQFVVAAFMMSNGGTSGIFLTCIQCYGAGSGGLGNFSVWPEYAAPVGVPLGEPSKDPSTGVWSRAYSAAIALVNPEAQQRTVRLPGKHWKDLYDRPVATPDALVLEPASGLVLLKSEPQRPVEYDDIAFQSLMAV